MNSFKSQVNHKIKQTWTGSKVALIELLYALHSEKVFNNGTSDLKDIAEYFEKIFGETKIGDLSIPVKITATNLVSGKLKIFDEDTLVTDAVLASAAFPGMLTPYVLNNNMYSDGGILNHFPTDLLQGDCDSIIGVYVSPIHNVEAKDLNSIKSITTRSFELLTARGNYQKFGLCDWVIEPKELANFSTFETSKTKMKAIFSIGYEEAQKTYNEIQSK